MSPERPPVSVVVPFAGSADEARRVVAQLAGLGTRAGDELIVADNSAGAVAEPAAGVQVVRAPRIASSYYARNAGADAATSPWLLFVDSDCLLPPTLIDDYFAEPPGEVTGIVAGGIEGDPEQSSLVARYHRSRGHLHADAPLEAGPSPAGGTANLLVRRDVWERLGGFHEVASGADFEFSWRAGELGIGVEHRPGARVRHLHPDEFRPMLSKARRYGFGQRWVERRYPGAARPPRLARELARALAGLVVWTLTARFERAAFKGIDGIWISAYARGWWLGSNRARSLEPAARDLARNVGIADSRPLTVDRAELARRSTLFVEDFSPLERARATALTAVRHPLRSARVRRRVGAPGAPSFPGLAAAALAVARTGARGLVPVAGDERTAALVAALSGIAVTDGGSSGTGL
jgi:GT2 family glycosyltransferase